MIRWNETVIRNIQQGRWAGAHRAAARLVGSAALSLALATSALAASPSATGSATPSSVKPGDWVLVEVKVTPGSSPTSTGISVKADLSGFGRSVAQDLWDNGSNGDKLAGDGTYSHRENVASAATLGAKTITATVRDAQARSATAQFSASVVSASAPPPPSPTAIQLAPQAVTIAPGSSGVLVVRVTPGSNPASTSLSVTADLRSIGGKRSQRMYDSGNYGDAVAADGNYSWRANIGSSVTAGLKNLPVSAVDAQSRSASASLPLTVGSVAPPPPPPTAPSGIGSAAPTSVVQGGSVLLSVAVTPGSNPTSSGLAVSADLSFFGLGSSAAFYDDGSRGDSVANDRVFSLAVSVPSSAATGSRSLNARISDAQGRQSNALFSLSVTAAAPPPPPPPPTGGSSHACSSFYAAGAALPEGRITDSVPTASRPPKGSAYADLAYGSCGVRATDHAAEAPQNFARNDYSRRQAFNADNSRFIVFSENGFWHLYDANSLQYLKVLPGLAGDAEPQWHPSEPSTLYYVATNGGTQLLKLNVESGAISVAADFAGKLPWSGVAHVWTKSEGSPSADGRYWCFMAENSSFGTLGVFTYDLQTGTVLGTKTVSARPDHISMSPSGRWCVVSHLAGSGGTVAWNTTFTQSRLLHGTSEHSDIAQGKDGHDVFVAVDYQSNAGDVFMLDIDTGLRTVLFPTYVGGSATAYHFSGKGYGKPGWVLVSAYAGYGPRQWYMDKVFAIELSANPRIVNLAHHHTSYNGYWTEPHASASRDFSRVLFNSNWGTTSDTDIDAYQIHLPPGQLD